MISAKSNEAAISFQPGPWATRVARGRYIQARFFVQRVLRRMTVRDPIRALGKHDLDLEVVSPADPDLMGDSMIVSRVVCRLDLDAVPSADGS